MININRVYHHILYNQSLYFGGCIASMNVFNIKQKRRKDNLSKFRYFTVSLMKGTIYGATYPVSLIVILSSVFNPKYFESHFIPCSIYGSNTD